MSLETKLEKLPSGAQQWTITLTGSSDVFRFAVHMLYQQVEFCEAGSEALQRLRKAAGARRFDEWATSMLGEDRYKQVKPYCMPRKRSEP